MKYCSNCGKEVKSFSNYAIATKGVKNPKTGDNIMIYALILLASLSSIIVLRKRKNESK